jgi:CRISPR-associated protein Csd1
MLSQLVDYAKSSGLTIEPGFKPKTVRWAIVCEQTGQFLNVQELGNPDQKNNRGKTFKICPDLTQPEMKAGGAGCRHFLVDNVEVVALMGKNGDIRSDDNLKENDKQKSLSKHDFFISLLRLSATVMKEFGLIASMLESKESLIEIQYAFANQNFKPIDRVTFAIVGRSPMYLVEDNAWYEWWREYRISLQNKKLEKKSNNKSVKSSQIKTMRCFGSGKIVEPAMTHPKIEGLSDVGGISMGDVLAGFKQEAFCSYFLTQSRNASLSEEIAAAYRAGLNHLISNNSQPLAGAKIVHWYIGEIKVEKQEDPMGLLNDSLDLSWLDDFGDEKQKERDALYKARLFLDSLQSGSYPRLTSLMNYHYYSMILTANSGRVVVREWIEGQFGELAESIVAWFEDLEITNVYGTKRAKSPKIESVITSLLPTRKQGQRYSEWIKPISGERMNLWSAATSCRRKPQKELQSLMGGEISSKVVSRIVPLHQAFILSGDFNEALDERSKNRARYLSILYARMALLKAYHIRKGDKNMNPCLNENHPHPAYHCGRLMAVYADLQRAALGDVGAGVVQRYYAAASVTPALILGRLSRGSQFHLSKLEGGLANWYEQRLTGIWARIQDKLPQTLTLEEQSLFALGYYQQIAARKKDDKNINEMISSEKGEEK